MFLYLSLNNKIQVWPGLLLTSKLTGATSFTLKTFSFIRQKPRSVVASEPSEIQRKSNYCKQVNPVRGNFCNPHMITAEKKITEIILSGVFKTNMLSL